MRSTTPASAALEQYWDGLNREAKENLAKRVGTTAGYLRQVFKYGKPAGAQMVRKLAEYTSCSRHAFRPDIYDQVS